MRRISGLIGLVLFSLSSGVFAAPMPAQTATVPSNQEVNQAMRSLSNREPKRHRMLLELRETDPDGFTKATMQVVREERRLEKMRRDIPANVALQEAMWKNREKLQRLAEEMSGETEVGGRAVVMSQIENLLGEQYDLRREMRMNKLKRLEMKVAQAKQQLQGESSTRGRQKFISAWKPKLLANGEKAAQKE